MASWAHEGAAHSPILAAISGEPDSGKTTLLGVLRFLVPKPFVSVEPTGPSVYRTVDREHPTLIIDEADDLFYRKSDLRTIVNAGWSRGTRIPRQGRWYDPFSPKILGILGKTKWPRAIASRSIILGVQLLAALRAMFTKNRTEITSEQVVQELLADPDSPWQEYRVRGPITKNQVAALLRDYDIRPVVVHPTKRADFSRHGYRAAQFEDAFARFLPHEPNIRTLKRGREGM